METNTWARVEMEFLSSERSERVRYQVEHEKRNSISIQATMYYFVHKHIRADVFDNFPKISDHFRRFPKIFQNCSERETNVFEHFPMMTEDC